MSKLTLPIQIGRQYMRRDGKVVMTIPSSNPLVASVKIEGEHWSGQSIWLATGLWSSEAGRTTHLDLVADYIEPEPVDAEVPKGHPHAALMALYAQDAAETAEPWKRWQFLDAAGRWVNLEGHPAWSDTIQFRRKPKTIRIGEFDVPEPLREPQPEGTWVWHPCLYGKCRADQTMWHDNDNTGLLESLRRGLCHLTQEAAELHARALLSFTSTTTGAPAA